MKRLYLAAAAMALALGVGAGAAQAEITTTGSVGAYSDYRLRGVSLSDKMPAIQGSLEFGLPVSENASLFAGVWASSLDKDAGFGALETDIYGGAKGTVGDLGWKLTYLRLVYIDEKNVDIDQFAGELTFPVGPVGGAVGFVRDEYGPGHSTYLYTSASYAFKDTPWSVRALIGWEDGEFYDNKVNWDIGVTYQFKKFAINLDYIDTNKDAYFAPTGKNLGAATAMFSVTSSF